MRATGMAALAVAPGVPAGAWAEVPDAYGLLTRGEFAALTGRAELSARRGVGVRVRQRADRAVRGRGVGGGVRPAAGALRPAGSAADARRGARSGAFVLFVDPEDANQDHGAFVVFGADPPTVAVTVTVYADEGQRAETALPKAMAVAKAVAGKVRGTT